MTQKSNHPDPKSFEEAYQRLEAIIKDLEKGDLKLDEIENRFEEGMKIAAFCTDRLEQVEQNVNLLIRNAQGQFDRKPIILNDDQ